ncbi:MAG TPA: hypothetical protein VFC56_04660 [Stellaceae bacterium]|nr:hypothetical protein [Stellaceae bacterium]
MSEGTCVRVLLSAAALLATASCSYFAPPPGQLALSNYRFDRAAVQAVVTAAPDCAAADPGSPAAAFELPFKGTRVIVAAPDTDICWRRQVPGGYWTAWNRAFTASGRSIDSQL